MRAQRPPKGWKRLDRATTAPLGWAWYSNGKSLFSREYRSILVREAQQ